MTIEKRQSQRIEIFGDLEGRAVLLNEPIEIREMSLGGLTIATRFPLKVGTSHEFQLTLGPRSAIVRGKVLHWRVLLEDDETRYIAGIQFVDVNASVSAWVREFLETLQVGERAG